MKVQYASDLHLEFPENKEFLKNNPILPVGDILILAGDIVPFSVMNKQKDFFSFASDHFKATYWIPGNHEYYHYDISTKSGTINEKIRENVFIVNNITITLENVNFIFSTLWSKINPSHQWEIEKRISDFQVIKYNGFRFSVNRYNDLHEQNVKFVRQSLSKHKNEKSIVISHHVPTFLNYPEKYKGDILNEAFAVELIDLIELHGPDFWIFGHHHYNCPDFTIRNTRLVTNQLGYVKYGEHHGFAKDININI